jgi:hypothetical protein
MRVHFWQFLLDEEGRPIEDAEISIFLAGGSTPASIYTQEIGGSPVSTSPQVETDSSGLFEFWIGDTGESAGYTTTQKFKLQWKKTGIATGSIDNVDVFLPVAEVDETSTNTSKNKLVSNLLAYRWEEHRTDETHTIHGIEEVEIVPSGATNVKDKLVSNELASGWELHKLDNTHTVHGIEEYNPSGSGTVRNKLVSNKDINDIYAAIGLGGPVAVAYYDTISSWSGPTSAGYYYEDIEHNLDLEWPVVQCYNSSTRKVEEMVEIESIDDNTTRIWSNDNTLTIKVSIVG